MASTDDGSRRRRAGNPFEILYRHLLWRAELGGLRRGRPDPRAADLSQDALPAAQTVAAALGFAAGGACPIRMN